MANHCKLSIYTLSGELVYSVMHNELFRGDLFWNLKNSNGNLVAPGLYIYIVEPEDGSASKIGKFAIIR